MSATPHDAAVDAQPPDGPAPYTERRWQLRANASQPGPLLGPRLVYHEARKTVILYGGLSDFTMDASAAMWELTAAGWQSLCNPCAPGPRVFHAMAYEPAGGRIVLFGGAIGDHKPALDSAWEWNGAAWNEIAQSGATRPGARQYAQLVYDRQRSRMLLIGGESGAGIQADVWSYAGGAWTPLQPDGAPSPGQLAGTGHWAAFDPARGVLALRDNRGAPGDELWAWNDGWTKICDNCSKRGRVGASLVYDPTLATTYLLNGFDTALQPNIEIDGTWALRGTEFVSATVEPRARDSEGVAYDANRDVIVVYGGNGDACPPGPFNCQETWEMVPDR